MDRKKILELIDDSSLWEDNESVMKDVRRIFEMAFKQEEVDGVREEVKSAGKGLVTREEFLHEIARLTMLYNEIAYEQGRESFDARYSEKNTSVTAVPEPHESISTA